MIASEKRVETRADNDLGFLWLEITAKCNLLCSHCYADSGPLGDLHGVMTYSDWTRVIDEGAELGCRSIQFIGGEPTLHPRLHDLVDHANHCRFQFIEVFTNATRLGQQLLGCFQRNRVHVATSFYSEDPLVHEQITQMEGSWQRTVDGIKTALAAGLPVRAGVIETANNQGHGARALDFLKRLGVQNARLDRERGVGRGMHHGLADDGERYEELCGQCWRGKLCVTSGGDVFPCVFSRATRLGDIKHGLRSILQTAKLTAFRDKVRNMYEAVPPVCTPDCEPTSSDTCNPCSPCCPICQPNCTPEAPNCNPPCSPGG